MGNQIRMTSLNRSHSSLGLGQVIGALIARASTSGGKKALAEAELADDVDDAQKVLDETEAMIALTDKRPDFDIEPCQGPADLLKKALKSLPLSGMELRLILPILKSADKISVVFRSENVGEESPLWVDLPPVTGLRELIEESIDEKGNVRADATPQIERLHKSVSSLGQSIRKTAENLLKDKGLAPLLQDEYVTLRDNRFVLPIKAEEKSHVDGIIHDSSNTGHTFFIEPKALVDLNNRLRTAEMELEHEISKLLRELSTLVAGEAEPIETIYASLTRLDVIHARGALAKDLGCSRPVFSDVTCLKYFASPVMLLEGKEVVRNDINMGGQARALIISGPNTGGKTVALKTIGLISLMARMGLFITAQAGSRIQFYDNIYADIGDRQSIEEDLSTFSAHLVAIKEVIENAGEGSLVLLDELMVSTDPNEGASLAVSTLDYLISKGAQVIVTTHFTELKTLAQTEGDFHNVSMAFDSREAKPTYRMVDGAPGQSSAIEVAEKLGLNKKIVASARARLVGGDERIEEALEELREQKQKLIDNQRKTQSSMDEAARLKIEARAIRDELEEQKVAFAKKAKQKLSSDIASAKRSIVDLVDKVRQSKGERSKAREALEKLQTMAEEAKKASAPEEKIGKAELARGDEVYVTQLERRGILSTDPNQGKVEVTMGTLRLSVTVDEVVGMKKGAKKGQGKVSIEGGGVTSKDSVSGEIHLRGMRVEAALELLEKRLDSLVKTDIERLRVIHGKGTGALKAAICEYLENSPYAAGFDPAPQNEGGGGVTIVILK
ncbi:Recombination inhibitory protein MutS2 [hydrothermal vent metagenome]|uniref:Recombination inhibitory protein MutS2 n=1 Tax=hydrothermal vent metagenome TaxID=652676 RepID=A0A3B1CAG3_9ZZZZ